MTRWRMVGHEMPLKKTSVSPEEYKQNELNPGCVMLP